MPGLQFTSSDSGPFPAVNGAWRSNLETGTRNSSPEGDAKALVHMRLPRGQLSNLERARPIIGLPTPRGRVHVYT